MCKPDIRLSDISVLNISQPNYSLALDRMPRGFHLSCLVATGDWGSSPLEFPTLLIPDAESWQRLVRVTFPTLLSDSTMRQLQIHFVEGLAQTGAESHELFALIRLSGP